MTSFPSKSEMQDETLRFPDIALLDRSKSFHSTAEGKMWTRLLINLSWWLHDMYEKDGCDPNEKFAYVENKLEQCKSLFPERFVLMFSNPEFSPNKQHPFLICRHDQHRTILLIFRATVSSKSIQDVFTDLRLYSNHDVYEGDRHAGFASRADSGPTLAVAHWLQQGWKVIISGHSLGGAVSQLFTARVIDSLVEIGLTVDRVVLRCITFGTPQCADHHFWSKYAAWYDIFDTYIYENDAIFRLVTFGTEAATSVAKAFANQIINYGKKVIQYIDNDQCRNLADSSFEQICINGVDILLPKYYVFGRHHFIMKDERANLMIKSIGELEEDRQRLMTDLKYGTKEWYKYFIEKEMMFSGSLKFVYRDFADHGCYPFAINQLFNEEANRRLGNRTLPSQKLLRSTFSNALSKSIFNILAVVYRRNKTDSCPDYIYLKGFLIDFICSVKLPTALVELKESREQATIIPQEQSDARAILFCRSDRAIEFLKEHSTFNIEITTFFNVTDIQVTVLSNEKNSVLQRMEHLDPISTALLSYHELVLDASSGDQYNDSPVVRCFSQFFDAFKHIDCDESDKIMARYLAEVQSKNYSEGTMKQWENSEVPTTDMGVYIYLIKELISLNTVYLDGKKYDCATRNKAEYLLRRLDLTLALHFCEKDDLTSIRTLAQPDFTDNSASLLSIELLFSDKKITKIENKTLLARTDELIPLHLEFSDLRSYLLYLHNCREIDTVRIILKCIMAVSFFVRIKLNRLVVFAEKYSIGDKLNWAMNMRPLSFSLKNSWKVVLHGLGYPFMFLYGLTQTWLHRARKTLNEISIALLKSAKEDVDKNKTEWQIFSQLSGCKQLHRIKNVKTEQERDMYWKKMYIEEPLKDMPDKYRWNWIGMMQICLQLNSMHEILLTKPPKLVLSGKSQTGKSTLFHHLTGQNLEELRNIDAFNTRMSLQCSALITFDENNHTKSELTIDVVDNPGQDDATEQARNLLNITLHTASLFIVVSTLEDVNQKHNIELIDYLLQETSVNILVLINKIDVRLFEEWIQFKNKSMIDDTSDHDDWEKGEDYVRDVTVPVNSNFNASDTVEKLIRRPKQELITSLIHDKKEIDRRLTIKPIILKQFKKVDTYYQDLRNFSRSDKNFLSQVSKSNVNKWIIENLTSVYD